MARILAVGITTIDVINELDGYPAEDEEVRAVAHRRARGGNAANLLAVLAQLGHECYLAGTLPWREVPGAAEMLDELHRQQIDIRHCRRVSGDVVPTSYICLNRQNGSRTIVHYRDVFPEFDCADFERIDLEGFDWVHFEGRNVDETASMMDWVASIRPSLPRSLEVEKARAGIDCLFEHANAIFFSASSARAQGYSSALDFLRALAPAPTGRTLVCSWGEEGASAIGPDGQELSCPAEAMEEVVDTIGAGDVFIAGVIDGLVTGAPLHKALAQGCGLAGAKCAQRGLDGLVLAVRGQRR